jgi:hypothetical protein
MNEPCNLTGELSLMVAERLPSGLISTLNTCSHIRVVIFEARNSVMYSP